MKCEEITPQVRGYLDDLLPEAARKTLRSHLAECSSCRTYSLMIGTFAGELKKITEEIPVPAGFDEAVLAAIQKPEPEPPRVSKKISPKAIALGASVFIMAASFLIYRQMPVPEKTPEVSKMTMAPGGEAELAQLKEIAEKLGVESPAPTAASKPVIAISLQPLHWHLRFSEKRLKEKFVSALQGKGIQMDYAGSSTMVLTVDREGFLNVLGLIENAEGLKAGGLVGRMKALPDFQGDVRISIVFEGMDTAQPGSLHWHLKLTLTNPFSLLDRLKEAGFVPVFENPDFWVFEVSSDEFALLRDELLNSYGVAVEMTGTVVPPAGNQKFPISFYLQESSGGSV